MARETTYIVQAFNAGKGGHLKPDSPIVCKSASGGEAGAEQARRRRLLVDRRSRDGRL
ncbi:hypothetical protein [Bradyrhizobium sp. Ce-3]|uniref:hypothetical protein n=1 Tax=Bradyrhizobium sp. Ce-3 TaxID=2913970 RepID=UPI001FC815A0|nr:hypothetical protein [Bradyrhizobium sp. Ce-3]